MAMEYFLAYQSYLKSIEPLNDAERGRLFTALLIYSSTGETPKLHGNERYIFPTMKEQIDRDKKKYDAKCKRNAENGKHGGRPSKEEKPNGFLENRTVFPKTQKSQDKEKEKDKGKGKYIPPYPPSGGGADEPFDIFWSAYPKKVGKQAAKKAFSKVKVPVETLVRAIEQQKCSDQWSKDNGQYIPNPSTWLNQGRWDDELPGLPTEDGSETARKTKRYFLDENGMPHIVDDE